MTMRERMLALVQGREHDRVPFVQYTGLAGPNEDIWPVIGRENMGLLAWTGVYWIDTPNCRFSQEDIQRDGRHGFRNTLHTPEGSLFEERLYEPTFGTSANACHFVKEPNDYEILLAYLRDIVVHMDVDPLLLNVKQLGDDGLPHTAVPRTPYQQLWVQWVDLTVLCVHLAMFPEVMEEVMAQLFEVQRRIFAAVRDAVRTDAPIPYIVFGDNVTAPAIGVEYFRKYCVASYNELAAMLADTGKDVPIFVHMDGDLKPLWRVIAESSVRGLDSCSPPPDNDTRVADAVANWPEMRVCLNFPSSVHVTDDRTIYNAAMQILEEGGHTGRLQIQISENVPPEVWRKSFPQIVKAIRDFGPIRAC